MTRSLNTLIHYLRHSIAHGGDAALTDAQLLERWVGQHDPAAFELMLWRHGPMVLNTCRRLLPRREDIEDAFQATFLVLVRKAGSIRRREGLAAWLHRVACRIACRARASISHRASREQLLAENPAAPEIETPAERELSAILDEEIELLPVHYRRALILCCLEGKSQEEAARLLNRPRGTVSSWLTRGRERLRQRLLRRGIVVSTAGLTAALTPDALSAGGMIPLIDSLVRMAGAVAAGSVVPTGLVSARSITLAEGVLRMMFMTKVRIVAAISLVVVVAMAGVGTWSHATRAADDLITLTDNPPKEAHLREPQPSEVPSIEQLRDLDLDGNFDTLVFEEKDSIAWGEKAHGLQAGIAFRRGDQETYEIGQSVTFVVYLRNVSVKKIDLSHIEPIFDERMPVVVDGNGLRLAVALGPIKLGRVSIVQRSLEAGQRITLGYPWFRIRPLDWRGEVVGPTCCIEPGRYKIGFIGLPVRLSDGRDISLGTKQVELNIRKSDSGKEHRSVGNAPAVEKQVIAAKEVHDETRLSFCSSRTFHIPFKVDPTKSEEIILLVSRDQGKTWRRAAKMPSTHASFHLRAPEDGIYWFAIQHVDEQGRVEPASRDRLKPTLRICVDSTPPRVQLFRPVRVNQNMVHLGWTAKDANLGDRSITLEWSEHKGGPWCLIGADHLPNAGIYRWHLPKGMPLKVYLRISVRDKAGNEARAATDEPISLVPEQSSKPEALLRDAEGSFNLNQYEEAIQKYEEIATMWDHKPAGLRALGGTIRCFAAIGDHERLKQQVKAIHDRLDTTEELTDEERQQWLKWLDMVEPLGKPQSSLSSFTLPAR